MLNNVEMKRDVIDSTKDKIIPKKLDSNINWKGNHMAGLALRVAGVLEPEENFQ